MTCFKACNECIAPEGFVCHGNFYTNGEYHRIVKEYSIHGVSFNQKIESVKESLDWDTLEILKVLLQETDMIPFNYETTLEIIAKIELIESRLSNDNKKILDTTYPNNPLVSGDEQ